jgi:alanyl-tRNA synthetase
VVADTGKPIDPSDLKEVEAIVSQQITDELPVYAKEASLVEAKRIMGLRAVFGEVSVLRCSWILFFCLLNHLSAR